MLNERSRGVILPSCTRKRGEKGGMWDRNSKEVKVHIIVQSERSVPFQKTWAYLPGKERKRTTQEGTSDGCFSSLAATNLELPDEKRSGDRKKGGFFAGKGILETGARVCDFCKPCTAGRLRKRKAKVTPQETESLEAA